MVRGTIQSLNLLSIAVRLKSPEHVYRGLNMLEWYSYRVPANCTARKLFLSMRM